MKNKKRKSFIQWLLAIFALVFLGAVSIFNIVPFAHATVGGSGLSDSNIGLTDSGNGTWTADVASINGSVSAKESSGCSGGTSYSSQSATLNIKNNKSIAATLSFSYTITLNSGSITVDGSSVTTGGSFSKNLSASGTVSIVLTSNASNANATSISITNISLVSETTVHAVFLVGQNGSYTVNGTPITSRTEMSQSSTIAFNLVATGASGYQFYCWRISTSESGIDNTQAYSTDANLSLQRDTDFYIKPYFIKSGTAVFNVNGTLYTDLNEANSAASSASTKLIVLNANGTLFEGTYTISSGVTLLIPYDTANTRYTNQPATESAATPSAFRTLSISNNVTLNVNGELNVSAKVSQADGRTSGKYGAIKFLNISGNQVESKINLKSGSKLYCWGYIWGNSGQIIAESGSTLYESFQLAGWRGGSATSDMLNNSQKVFPVNQYFVQNIEVFTKINYGASEILFTATTMSIVGTSKINVDFIGTSAGMFRLSSGSYVTKRYDPLKDTLFVEAYGTVTLSSITIKANVTVNSANYVLPISSCMDITIKNSNNANSPSEVITNQDLAIFPGAKLSVEQNAKLTIKNNNSVFVYDYDQWRGKGYSHTNSGYPCINTNDACLVYYSPNTARVKKTTLVDAEIDINGSISVASGAGLYTTTSGAHIHSSEKTGSIVFSNGPGSVTVTYQAVQSGTDISYDSISVTNAKLHNGEQYYGTDDEYYLTNNVEPGYNVGYNARDDKWGETPQIDITIHVLFRDRDNANNSFTKTYEYPSESFDFPTQAEAGFTNANNYKLRKWINDNNDIYDPGENYIGEFEDNIIFYAYYGGWLTDSDNVSSYTYRTSDTNATHPYGIATVEALVGAGDETYLFEANGVLSSDTKIFYFSSATYPNGDNKYYYVVSGIVNKNAGLIYIDTDGDFYPDSFYFIDAQGTAITSQVKYIGENSYGLSIGYYEFGSNGKMIIPGEPQSISSSDYVKDGTNGSGNTVYGYGLFHLTISGTTHLYYGKDDGTIVKNCTFYVKKTNDYFVNGISSSAILIEEGVYYFDNNGYMWYGNNLLDDTNAEFGVIVSGNGVIIGRNN